MASVHRESSVHHLLPSACIADISVGSRTEQITKVDFKSKANGSEIAFETVYLRETCAQCLERLFKNIHSLPYN